MEFNSIAMMEPRLILLGYRLKINYNGRTCLLRCVHTAQKRKLSTIFAYTQYDKQVDILGTHQEVASLSCLLTSE